MKENLMRGIQGKNRGMTYCDCSRVSINPIKCTDAKPIIINKHYSHTWTACRYSYGVYYDKILIGCIVYGSPVGRLTIKSICKKYPLTTKNTMELTRLWIADGYGSNIESFSIGQSFKYLKKEGIEVIISYADPYQNHLGIIYQATNFLYQGDSVSKGKKNRYFYNGKWIHAKTIYGIFGTTDPSKLDESIKIEEVSFKHRYIYILNKKKRKQIVKDLKHPIKSYPK